MQVESGTPFFETPEEIWYRVFHALKPRTAPPAINIEFCPFANADSYARIEAGQLSIRISDMLEGASALVLEALAYVLLGKLFKKPIPAIYGHRYRVYLNRSDMRRKMHLIRQIRGRKFVSGPQGEYYNLDTIFEELNFQYFNGLLARPLLGWSRRPSRTTLGHFDPSHNAIIISKIFDQRDAPRRALEYVIFHEMLHLRFPVQSHGARRRIHTRQFHEAEKDFLGLKEAKELLKKL
jgi:hypothetical protein